MEVIRRIRVEDTPRVRDVRLMALATDPLAFGSTHAEERTRADDVWIEYARLHAEGSERAIFLALRDDQVVGLVRASRDEGRNDLFGVYSLWVAPTERHRGVATKLLDVLESWVGERGGNMLELWVSDAAPDARRLYARLGFIFDGRSEPSHPGVTEHGMLKFLPGFDAPAL